jgi:LemA protein
MGSTTVPDKANADNMMTGALKSVFAVAENYPQLKADTNFIQFQNRISEIETQIRDRREFYNDSVNIYNIRLEQLPYVFIGNMLHYTRKDLFKVEEASKKDVDVSF